MVMLQYMEHVAEDSLEVPSGQTLNDNNKHSLVVNTLFATETREYIFYALSEVKNAFILTALCKSLYSEASSFSEDVSVFLRTCKGGRLKI